MSSFSGKFDLYDEIYMTSDENKTDEQLFEEFKKKTGGKIYQSFKVEGDTITKDRLLGWIINGYTKVVTEKDGVLYYFDKKVTLNKLKKEGIWLTRPILFSKPLDLVPYYPYICGLIASDENHLHVEIGEKSYIQKQDEEDVIYNLKLDDSRRYYKDLLAQEYVKILKGEK